LESGDTALCQFALVAVTAFRTSVIGSLTGYGARSDHSCEGHRAGDRAIGSDEQYKPHGGFPNRFQSPHGSAHLDFALTCWTRLSSLWHLAALARLARFLGFAPHQD
jgi:hypothetical protein